MTILANNVIQLPLFSSTTNSTIASSSSSTPSSSSKLCRRHFCSCRRRDLFRGRRLGALFIVSVASFCLLNVYRSATLSNRYVSSHEYFRRESDDIHRVAAPVHDVALSTAKRRGSVGGGDGADGDNRPAGRDRLSRIRPVRPEDYPKYNMTMDDGTSRTVPLWQRKLVAQKRNNSSTSSVSGDDDLLGPYYFLTELLQVRIYANDKARWTVAELKQWLHYMFLAGVEHVYVCDHYANVDERLDGPLAGYIAAGLATYLPWGGAGRDPMTAQIRCYQRIVDRFRWRHRWQIAVDMDEYPFAPNDTAENFLVRYLEQVADDVSEVLLPNYLMLGRGDRQNSNTVIQRIVRMTPEPANDLVKPIYRPERIRGANVHHNHLESGNRLKPRPDEMRMLHYWGGRGQNYGPDTPKILATTVLMTAMRDAWSHQLENSLIVFGERDAFSNETGP